MAMAAGFATATLSISRAIVSRGHGHAPSASIDRRSISMTTTCASRCCGWVFRHRWSAARMRSNAVSRMPSRRAAGINKIATRNAVIAPTPATAGVR
jgi:hypothetical protein